MTGVSLDPDILPQIYPTGRPAQVAQGQITDVEKQNAGNKRNACNLGAFGTSLNGAINKHYKSSELSLFINGERC